MKESLEAWMALCIFLGTLAMLILIIWYLAILPAIKRYRRGRFLDSLRNESIEKVREVAEKIGFTRFGGKFQFYRWSTCRDYPAGSLGRIIESLLNDNSTDENYQEVAEFWLDRCGPIYRRRFLAAFGRHERVAIEMKRAVLRIQNERRDARLTGKEARQFEKGLALCGYKPKCGEED